MPANAAVPMVIQAAMRVLADDKVETDGADLGQCGE
jgi:hypothetical protein